MSNVSGILSQIRPEVDFSASDDFFNDGALDSFDLITLVSEIDRAYGVSIDGMDIVPDNFSSVVAIEALIERYGRAP